MLFEEARAGIMTGVSACSLDSGSRLAVGYDLPKPELKCLNLVQTILRIGREQKPRKS
jgi:hypothetical protein